MELIVTSVVILVVHQGGVSVFKSKGQTPVAIDTDRPVARKAALEGVPVPTWSV
jgi:hypothetical protein